MEIRTFVTECFGLRGFGFIITQNGASLSSSGFLTEEHAKAVGQSIVSNYNSLSDYINQVLRIRP